MWAATWDAKTPTATALWTTPTRCRCCSTVVAGVIPIAEPKFVNASASNPPSPRPSPPLSRGERAGSGGILHAQKFVNFDSAIGIRAGESAGGNTKCGLFSRSCRARRCQCAYYAAFGWARNYAESELGFVPQSGSEDHRRLREHFRQQGLIRVASDLNRLRAWRNACGYERRVPQLPNYVRNSIQIASNIIQECQ